MAEFIITLEHGDLRSSIERGNPGYIDAATPACAKFEEALAARSFEAGSRLYLVPTTRSGRECGELTLSTTRVGRPALFKQAMELSVRQDLIIELNQEYHRPARRPGDEQMQERLDDMAFVTVRYSEPPEKPAPPIPCYRPTVWEHLED